MVFKNRKLLFLSSFSNTEWALNGHKRENANALIDIFESLLPYIKDGKYLELGCGTGILCRFIYLFSKRKIIPYGVDKNPRAIYLAKKNNSEFKDNFIVSDYFELNESIFSGISTIVMFMATRKGVWDKSKNIIHTAFRVNNSINIIMFSYDHDLSNITNFKIIQFISEIKQSMKLIIANSNFLVITKKCKELILK